MNEEFLYFLWKFQKFDIPNLKTTDGNSIQVVHTGYRNLNSGPDFFNSRLIINGQDWAGNVEMHIKSSDWLLHGHQTDLAFDNVILHVVWEHDKEIYHKDGSLIPVLELKDTTPDVLLHNYQKLIEQNPKWIYCENEFGNVPDFMFNTWIQKLFIERLEQKSNLVYLELEKTNGNWEEVLFRMFAKSFGTKVNSEAFLSIARSLDFKLIQRLAHSEIQLKSLLLGRAGLIHKVENTELYETEFQFLSKKHKLVDHPIIRPLYFRLRPANFPHLRLLQLAQLYLGNSALFQLIMQSNSLTTVLDILKTAGVSQSFAEHLVLNAIIPVKFCYGKELNEPKDNEILTWVEEIRAEKNSIIEKFMELRNIEKNALISQGLIQLKNQYCSKKGCLGCDLGNFYIRS